MKTFRVHIYSLNFTVDYISKFETTARVKSGLPSQFNAVLLFSSLKTYCCGFHWFIQRNKSASFGKILYSVIEMNFRQKTYDNQLIEYMISHAFIFLPSRISATLNHVNAKVA